MEYIIEDVENKTFVKVNGKLSPGIAYLKIFEVESDAHDYIEQNLPTDENLHVINYEGFTS
jgi:hypothetical protein